MSLSLDQVTLTLGGRTVGSWSLKASFSPELLSHLLLAADSAGVLSF